MGGINLYAYAGGNPIAYADPYGLCVPVTLCAGLIGIAVGGGSRLVANLATGRPWHENVGRDAALGGSIGLTLGLAAPVLLAVSTPAVTEGSVAAGRVLLEAAKQGKHVPGHKNFIPGRSVFTHADPQGLLDRFAGTGQRVAGVVGQAGSKERVNFGEVIGTVNVNGVLTETMKGIIHYSKNGAHIVPANP